MITDRRLNSLTDEIMDCIDCSPDIIAHYLEDGETPQDLDDVIQVDFYRIGSILKRVSEGQHGK